MLIPLKKLSFNSTDAETMPYADENIIGKPKPKLMFISCFHGNYHHHMCKPSCKTCNVKIVVQYQSYWEYDPLRRPCGNTLSSSSSFSFGSLMR